AAGDADDARVALDAVAATRGVFAAIPLQVLQRVLELGKLVGGKLIAAQRGTLVLDQDLGARLVAASRLVTGRGADASLLDPGWARELFGERLPIRPQKVLRPIRVPMDLQHHCLPNRPGALDAVSRRELRCRASGRRCLAGPDADREVRRVAH